MIWYDSHDMRTLFKIRGSVLPRSMVWAIPSAVIAFLLRHFEEEQVIQLDFLNVLSQGDIYSGFTFVLGFSLVFRTSQSYLRYWTAATSVHEMSCEWSDGCAGLISFATISKASTEEVMRFRHTVVRLFSLLHAVALTEIADVKQQLPLLDIEGLSNVELTVLTQANSQGKKVQIVMSWIKSYIIEVGDNGLLNVPAPILTRIFQELQNGLVNYHKALQIVIWPFPFPYTQLNFLLVTVYTLITPVVVSTWATWAGICALFTFVSVTCMVGLEIISCELENPFGEDANDLPILEMQKDMNKFLTMQLNPLVHQGPRLVHSAVSEYKDLCYMCYSGSSKELKGTKDPINRSATSVIGESLGHTWEHRCRGNAQSRWRGVASSNEEIRRLEAWLGISSAKEEVLQSYCEQVLEPKESVGKAVSINSNCEEVEITQGTASAESGDLNSSSGATNAIYHSVSEWEAAFRREVSTRRPSQYTMEATREWSCANGWEGGGQLRQVFEKQLEMQRKELSVIEGLLGQFGQTLSMLQKGSLGLGGGTPRGNVSVHFSSEPDPPVLSAAPLSMPNSPRLSARSMASAAAAAAAAEPSITEEPDLECVSESGSEVGGVPPTKPVTSLKVLGVPMR